MSMSEPSIEEYTEKMRSRYGRMTGRKARGRLLDEFVQITGWDRKHANKVLLGKRRRKGRRGQRGAPRRYGSELSKALKTCWLAMEQPCGKRMKDMLPLWVAHLECREETRGQLAAISAASIDRLLRDLKVKAGKKPRPPRPASAVKAPVNVRAQSWDTEETGWTEVDTVAHYGGDMGGEFLNFHLYQWLKKHGIAQSRSRPYYKNDQAYVEQKNWTHVRQLLGYDRLEHRELLGELNELLTLWSQWRNLFCVTMKQASKRREGSRQIRRHEKESRTPARRLIDSGQLRQGAQRELERQLSTLNPFALRKEISRLEDRLWRHRAELYAQEAGTALALAGAPPLRSVAPARASQPRTTNQAARVSEL